MVVKGHASAFFDEKENETVVFGVETVNRHSVQVTSEVVRTLSFGVDAHFIWSHSRHIFDQGGTARISDCPVQEGSMAGAVLSFEAQFFYGVDQFLHCVVKRITIVSSLS